MTDYFSHQDRRTRRRETVEPELEIPELQPLDEPMQVQEDPLSETGVRKFVNRVNLMLGRK